MFFFGLTHCQGKVIFSLCVKYDLSILFYFIIISLVIFLGRYPNLAECQIYFKYVFLNNNYSISCCCCDYNLFYFFFICLSTDYTHDNSNFERQDINNYQLDVFFHPWLNFSFFFSSVSIHMGTVI